MSRLKELLRSVLHTLFRALGISAKENDIVADFRNAQIVHGSSEELHDVKAAGFLMMELMHHERPTDGKIRVLDSHRGAEVVDFLAQIELGSSAAKLVKVMSILESRVDLWVTCQFSTGSS